MKPLPASDLAHILRHAPWRDLQCARLFLTGATGFFGAWLLESFCHANRTLNLNATATVLTRDPVAFRAKMPHLAGLADIHFQSGDVRDFTFPDGKFTHCLHAATTSASALPPTEVTDVIENGTRRVLQFSESVGVTRFLYVSSGAAAGPQPRDVSHLAEDGPGAPNPDDAYGQGKRAAEALVAAGSGDFDVVIARAWAFVGPHLPLDAHFAAGNFLRDALHRRPIEIAGDGTPVRTYLYAADLAAWLWTLLIKGENRRIYNVGSDEPVSIADLAHRCAALRSPSLEVRIARAAASGERPVRYVPNIERARSELGLAVWIPLDDALRRTFEWYSSL